MWDEAAVRLPRKAWLGGNLKRKDTANIMYGMALFNQKKTGAGPESIPGSWQGQPQQAPLAQQWIKYVDSEITPPRYAGTETT